MQCSTCRATLPDGSVQCYSCGANLQEKIPPASPAMKMNVADIQASDWQEYAADTVPVPSPVSGREEQYFEPGWAEFSGAQAPEVMPGIVGTTTPPTTPAPGGYGSSSNFSYVPGSMPPGFVPPFAPPPKSRRLPFNATVALSVLLLLLISGGILIGLRIGQSQTFVAASSTPRSVTANSSPDANQLYQQVTSQKPIVVDSLQDSVASSWAVFEKPKYGCEIKSDGLHVHIDDPGHFTYCTSGRGKFSNFAFQVEMTILSGDGGGLTIRGDSTAGNNYFFHVFPDGGYRIYVEKNHQVTTTLNEGAIRSFVYSANQKNVLTVIAQGNQMSYYDNQKLITTVQDSTYTNGYIGVSASDSNASSEIVYTNAQIWML